MSQAREGQPAADPRRVANCPAKTGPSEVDLPPPQLGARPPGPPPPPPAWSALPLNKIKPLLMPLLIIILVGIGSAVVFYAVGERSNRNGEFGFGCSILTLVYFLHRTWARQTPA